MGEDSFVYDNPIIDGLNSSNDGDIISPKGVQWIWETNYVALVEYGVAGFFLALLYVLVSQVDLTP